MPDETTRTVTVDGVTWTKRADGQWMFDPVAIPSRAVDHADEWLNETMNSSFSRIAALEAEREEIEKALQAIADTPWYEIGDAPDEPAKIDSLLSWHRARGATHG